MKNTFSALLFLATSVLAVPAFAQGTGYTPNPANMVARLTKILDLTAAQQTQATTIFTNEQTAIAPIQAQVKTARASLTAAVQSNTTATIDSVTAQLGTLNGQILDIQSRAQAAFYAILTSDQQTKYSAMHGGAGATGAFRGRRS